MKDKRYLSFDDNQNPWQLISRSTNSYHLGLGRHEITWKLSGMDAP